MVHAGPSIAERMRRSPSAHVYVEGLRGPRVSRTNDSVGTSASWTPTQSASCSTQSATSRPRFFRLLRADVCALYLSDAGVWHRIGFPGPSSASGGYPDFDQPQAPGHR